MKTFKLHTNGKTYNVAVRGSYEKTITSEKKLIEALKKAAESYAKRPTYKEYGQSLMSKIEAGKIHEVCSILGILSYSCPETK
jgi:hypothetical protein